MQSNVSPVVQAATSPGESPPPASLDALARLNLRALETSYASASPGSLDALTGHPRGRMLAVRGLDRGPAFRGLRRLAGATAFPWCGKSFIQGPNAEHGRGINRVRLGGRHSLFPFHTQVQPSVLDGQPCIALNYDLPDNPAAIRAIHDEVREVFPGLYLGPAMWKHSGRHTLVLWFALDTRIQAHPIGEA